MMNFMCNLTREESLRVACSKTITAKQIARLDFKYVRLPPCFQLRDNLTAEMYSTPAHKPASEPEYKNLPGSHPGSQTPSVTPATTSATQLDSLWQQLEFSEKRADPGQGQQPKLKIMISSKNWMIRVHSSPWMG